MRDSDGTSFLERLAALRAAYGAALPARLGVLRDAARRLRPAASLEEIWPVLEDLRAAAHMLAGSAPSFGFAAVGQSARALERQVKALLLAGGILSPGEVQAIQGAMDALIGRAREGCVQVHVGTIALIAVGGDAGGAMAQRLEHDGYEVIVIGTAADIAHKLPGRKLCAILVQADGPIDTALTILDSMRGEGCGETPAVFFAEAESFGARYATSRAGGVGFLVAPLRMPDLSKRLEALIAPVAFQPYRVLYVGADAPALDGAAFVLRVEADPSALLHRIKDFRPELLLLSTELNSFDAVDLARMVWQDEAHRALGIFFLSRDPAVHRAVAARGVTDTYFLAGARVGALDGVAVQARITPYLHDRRAGLRPPNHDDLGPHLARMAGHMGGASSMPPASMLPAPAEKQRRKVLIVDDDRYLVAMLAHALAEYGADVLRAYSGDQGYAAAWQELPSAIISDVEMPNGTGDRMIQQLRGNPRTRDIPVIVMTNRRWEGNRDYALERDMRGRLGASAYLQKPVRVEKLVQELARL